jgi:hypothetical protein
MQLRAPNGGVDQHEGWVETLLHIIKNQHVMKTKQQYYEIEFSSFACFQLMVYYKCHA